jgi:hypothetical protein
VILSESGAPFHEFIQSHMSVLKNIIMFWLNRSLTIRNVKYS